MQGILQQFESLHILNLINSRKEVSVLKFQKENIVKSNYYKIYILCVISLKGLTVRLSLTSQNTKYHP